MHGATPPLPQNLSYEPGTLPLPNRSQGRYKNVRDSRPSLPGVTLPNGRRL
jgi:hypothetical protein